MPISSLYQRIIEWFLPPAETNVAQAEREKRLVRTSFFLALTMVPIAFVPETPQTEFWLRKTCFFGSLAMSICPFLFKFWPHRKHAKTIAASFFCTVLLGLNVVITSSLGGWHRISYSNVTATPLIGFYVGGVTTGLWCTFLTVAHLVHFYLAGTATVTDPTIQRDMSGELLVLLAYAIVSCFIGYSYETTVDGAWRVVNRTLRQVGTINGGEFPRASEKISSAGTPSDAVWSGGRTPSSQSRSDFRLSKAKSSGAAISLRRKSDLVMDVNAAFFRRPESEEGHSN